MRVANQSRTRPCSGRLAVFICHLVIQTLIALQGPWVRVGVLHIPQQEFTRRDQMLFCRDLAFSPWHTIDAHRPLGGVNLIRKTAYEAGASARNQANGRVVPEPTGDETFSLSPVCSILCVSHLWMLCFV